MRLAAGQARVLGLGQRLQTLAIGQVEQALQGLGCCCGALEAFAGGPPRGGEVFVVRRAMGAKRLPQRLQVRLVSSPLPDVGQQQIVEVEGDGYA